MGQGGWLGVRHLCQARGAPRRPDGVFWTSSGSGSFLPPSALHRRDGRLGGNGGPSLRMLRGDAFFATPFLGRLSDRVGRRPVILVSLAGNALSMIGFAVATKLLLLPVLFFSRVVAGATAGNISACSAAVSDVTNEQERARAMGKIGAGLEPWAHRRPHHGEHAERSRRVGSPTCCRRAGPHWASRWRCS